MRRSSFQKDPVQLEQEACRMFDKSAAMIFKDSDFRKAFLKQKKQHGVDIT
jgi:hypothetical protein